MNNPLELATARAIIGKIQQALYKNGAPINSYEPFHAPIRAVTASGQFYVSEIKYDSEYPNSYFDVTYPNEDTSVRRPTVVYLHGGGYFGGDKAKGDPLAADNDATRLYREITANGYNFVNVNYALVPDHHFPVPLIQFVRAMDYLWENAHALGLDMSSTALFGQSAGAALVGQYGALLTSSTYREQLGLTPQVPAECVKCLIIDDAPLLTEAFHGNLKLLIGNYLDTMDMRSEVAKKYNAFLYLNKAYPASFMTAGNTDGFPDDMSAFSKRLTELGVNNEYFFVPKDTCELPHGYTNMVDSNSHARECFDHILRFIRKYTA